VDHINAGEYCLMWNDHMTQYLKDNKYDTYYMQGKCAGNIWFADKETNACLIGDNVIPIPATLRRFRDSNKGLEIIKNGKTIVTLSDCRKPPQTICIPVNYQQ
jgi:hypothetical protein